MTGAEHTMQQEGAGYIMPGSHGLSIPWTTHPGRMLETPLKLLCLQAPSLVLCARGVGFFTGHWWSPTCTTSCSSNPTAPQLPAYCWRRPALLAPRTCGMFPKLPRKGQNFLELLKLWKSVTKVLQFFLEEKYAWWSWRFPCNCRSITAGPAESEGRGNWAHYIFKKISGGLFGLDSINMKLTFIDQESEKNIF